jgi:DNA-directed RNA polymerase beta subunit
MNPHGFPSRMKVDQNILLLLERNMARPTLPKRQRELF